MHDSPRVRRLRNDLLALERLRDESSVFRFQATGNPAQHYVVRFRGRGLMREKGKVTVAEGHEVEIKLGSSYPRTIPEIRWTSPIYHPNISEIGMVCLGGYGTHWVPSLTLDELCGMLWDMARYHNYDIRSPYNRDAALWVANQSHFRFPIDPRPLRDLRAALGRVPAGPPAPSEGAPPDPAEARRRRPAAETPERVRKFLSALRGTASPEPGPVRPEPAPTPVEPPRDGEAAAHEYELVLLEPTETERSERPGPTAAAGAAHEAAELEYELVVPEPLGAERGRGPDVGRERLGPTAAGADERPCDEIVFIE